MRAHLIAATRLPVREVGPSGVIRTIFMDHGHADRPTSGASAGDLVAQLRETRLRTRRLTEDLSWAGIDGTALTIVNPLLWEIGHVAWFQSIGRCVMRKGSVHDDAAIGCAIRRDCARHALGPRPSRSAGTLEYMAGWGSAGRLARQRLRRPGAIILRPRLPARRHARRSVHLHAPNPGLCAAARSRRGRAAASRAAARRCRCSGRPLQIGSTAKTALSSTTKSRS